LRQQTWESVLERSGCGGADTPTLYQRVLGDRFAALHPTLQRFHSSPHGGRGVGMLQVTRAPDVIRSLVATLMRLPPASDATPVTLEVLPEANGERWRHHFGRHRFETLQTERQGLDAARDFIYAIIFGTLRWAAWYGLFAWLLLLLLASEN